MTITIKNCNNIDSAEVELTPSCLNIKYALNGTGKSSIARAIAAFVNNDEEEKKLLLPFKYKDAPDGHELSVQGIEGIDSVKIFNESYLERFVFTQDVLFPNTFDVFVKTDGYDARMKSINSHLQKIHALFKSNEKINDLLSCFDEFVRGFGKSAKGLSKVAPIAKGIAKGNLIANIPAGLECFAAYICSEMQNNWIKWHAEGDGYLPLQQDCCPYCAQGIAKVMDRVRLVSQKYDANTVKHLVDMVNVFKNLATEGLSPETSKFVNDVTASAEGFSEEDSKRLLGIKRQVESLSQRLRTLQSINFYTEKDNPAMIKDKLNGLRLDSSEFEDLKSDKVNEVVAEVNSTIDFALASVDDLQREIAEQQKHIADEIKEYDKHINAFMELAGYPYQVSIVDLGNGEYRTRLSHVDMPNGEIQDAKKHLSYGEKNAFALSLFVYDAVNSKSALVVLDDPISSFDGNKKFALLKMMFWDEEWKTLAGKTVLMLTHDFCPVIDVMKTFSDEFPSLPTAWYLKCVDGCIKESEITKANVKSALDINRGNVAKNDKDVLLRIVYYRKWLELKGEMGGSVHDLLSNLEHLREVPKRNINGAVVDMPNEAVVKALNEIKKRITCFDYCTEVNRASNLEVLRTLYDNVQCNFEKVLIFRYMVKAYEKKTSTNLSLDGIIRKYMNEPFHVENDYVYQLNPCEYDPVSDLEIQLFDAKVNELFP